MLSRQKLTDLVLGSFEDEKRGDTTAAKAKLHPDFKVIDAWISTKDELFPGWDQSQVSAAIDEYYQINERDYEFHALAVDEPNQTVMVEFIEMYPDPKTGQLYRTPQVAICQIKDDLMWRTRHYCDPRLSFKNLTQADTDRLFN